MVSKNPNLLEAFQTASRSAPDKEKPSGGPVVPPAPRTPSDYGGGVGRDVADSAAGARSPGGLLLALAVACFASGVFIGRWTARPAIAGDGQAALPAGTILAEPSTAESTNYSRPPLGRPNTPTDREPARAIQSDKNRSAPVTAQDKLLSPANRFTAVAVTYGEDDDAGRRAQEIAGHLVALGFEAVPVRELDGHAMVLVGAAPDLDSIKQLCKRLHATRDDRGALAFDTAYPVNIDDFINR